MYNMQLYSSFPLNTMSWGIFHIRTVYISHGYSERKTDWYILSSENLAWIFFLLNLRKKKKHSFQLKQACASAAKQLCYSIPLEWTMQRHAAMQLTGIKTIGKMTDYTRIEVCVSECACMHPCTHVHFLWLSVLPKLYILNIFTTHVLEY